ncbi:glycogen/starch/alpha-glucan phosphorylase [Clostridium sp.]|uniref:glycogen/starch/alpha-glucan phosphorylase n=1 Tax=Clostridium sp. TaxID=1506 RepID=UPI0032172FD8
MIRVEEFKETMNKVLKMYFGTTLDEANCQEVYNAVSKAVLESKFHHWKLSDSLYSKSKETYYFSIEFLMGRALGNNLMNLSIDEEVLRLLKEINIDIKDVEAEEYDAAFGNGGLGRLASCFLDSSATLNLPVKGYGIKYHQGLFKQSFKDGFQVEEGDNWIISGEPWQVKREKEQVEVNYNDFNVKAIPYDMPIFGYNTDNVNTLRLWDSEPVDNFNFSLFNEGKFDESMKNHTRAKNITRVLYPNDANEEGKILRIRQEYFFVSASLQDIIRQYKKSNGNDFSKFHELVCIQLNDTHPVVAIPELMRLLVDFEGVALESAWYIACNTFAYTNHTVLAEALEKWDVYLYVKLLPRVYEIIQYINNILIDELRVRGIDQWKINRMRIIQDGVIHMASLAVYGSRAINGVAEIHTEILKNSVFKDWYEIYPSRFQNKTNGISPRRWLNLCNEELSEMITDILGDNKWVTNLSELKKLEQYINDEDTINRFLSIKHEKKKQLADYIKNNEGIEINPNSIFNIQVKRVHEYKRQLLNALIVLDLYFTLKENPELDFIPVTFIFGGKAAPGYFRAKGIIKFINDIGNLVNNDEQVRDKIKVVYVKNYNVSYGERIFPAADLSIQISTAGKEASGTGNMKFMINGTPTLGTLDGANVEIIEEVGKDNNFIFGATVEELKGIKDSYNPKYYYENVKGLKRAVDTLIDGTFNDKGSGMYKELYNSLIIGCDWQKADNYYVLKDFEEYREALIKVNYAYKNKMAWGIKCLKNLIYSAKFSSDRTVEEYARDIWHIHPHGI